MSTNQITEMKWEKSIEMRKSPETHKLPKLNN